MVEIPIGARAYYSKPTPKDPHHWWIPQDVKVLAIGKPGKQQRIKVLCDGKETWVSAARILYPHPDDESKKESLEVMR